MATKKAAKKAADTKTARARIRMYRVGLGDCFLLTFFTSTKKHILIDCGMFAGSRLKKERKEKDVQIEIAQHIAQETKNKLDVVVVTHEHMDHVSIFNSAKTVFDGIRFGEAWFGWVESNTKAARDLREKFEGLETALSASLAALQSRAKNEPEQYAGLHLGVAGIAEFAGFAADGSKIKEQPRRAMDYVKKKVGKANMKFGSPGDVWEFAGTKVHVLGPPPKEQQLRVLERAGATYDKAFAAQLSPDSPAAQPEWFPFSEEWRTPVERNQENLRFSSSIDKAPLQSVFDAYCGNPENEWRRIDDQSLESASTLALQMDNFINNTSLALAFELPGGDVLLFPGDAQVGNWDSWFEIEEFSTGDLLKRTIFYKVGHHGSHNATLKAALEQMTHPGLVAMIPTNASFAKKSKKWNMPARNLHKALEEHTAGRLLRNDQGLNRVPDPLTDGDWGKLKSKVTVDPLFIDYYV